MMFRFHAVVFLITILIFPPGIRITDAEELSLLTLSEAVGISLEHNRELRAVRFDRMAAATAKNEALSPLFPQLSFKTDASKIKSDKYSFDMPAAAPGQPDFGQFFDFDQIGFTGPQYQTKIQMGQLIFDHSVLGNIRLSNLRDEAAHWQEIGQEQAVVFSTVAAYLDILQAQELLGVQNQRLKLADKQLQTAETNFAVGLRIRTDVLRAKLTRSSALRDVVSAEIQLEKAQAALNRILGIPLEARHEFEGGALAAYDPPDELIDEFKNYERYFEVANEKHPSIKVAHILVKQSEESVGIARGEFMPKVSAGASWGWNDSGNPDFKAEEWAVQAAIEIPIFEGGRKVAKVRRTKEQLDAEKMRFEDTVRAVQNLVEQSALALQEEQRNLEIAIEAEQVAQENYDRFSNLYEEGLADSLDLTQALTELVVAQTSVVTTRYGYLLVFTQMLQALGIIPTDEAVYASLEWLDLMRQMQEKGKTE
ncbi:MAG: TolC family protein [Candidatus Omnitrophota bacterium]|jgi:outer membrane protein|nr:MAG: TolC family protein [Candidatus Omnitrophota bacterium]